MEEEIKEQAWIEGEEESKEEFEAELWLSTDGKNTIRVMAKTSEGRKAAMTYAKAVYDRLIDRYGTKTEQQIKTHGLHTDGKSAPICGIHNVPMNFREGGISKTSNRPYPAFWACPAKMPDGSYCKFRNKS